MRPAQEIRDDLAALSGAMEEHEARGELLRLQLAHLLRQARDHPELTIEEARKIPAKTIGRQTAYELIRELG